MRPNLLFFVENCHMGLGHDGLMNLLEQFGRSNKSVRAMLRSGSGWILCVNRAKTKVKVINASGFLMGYLKIPKGNVTPESIEAISTAFGGSGFVWTRELKSQLLAFLGDAQNAIDAKAA
jgi:hypothetical protein